MNTLKIILKESGSVADVDINFRLFKNGYRNAKLDVCVPSSLIDVQDGFQVAVKTGAILIDTNGKKITTEPFELTYNRTETIEEIEYKVYRQDLPALYLAYEGNQTIVANVVMQATLVPTVERLITSKEVVINVLNSAYLEDEPLYPTQEEQIWGAINQLAEDKEDKIDDDIEVNAEKIVSSQRVATAINDLNDQVTTNKGDIATQSQSIADLSNRVDNVERNENPIGQMEVTSLPTDEQLNAYVLEVAHRQPEYNDVITVVLNNDGVFTTYKYYYSIDNWQHYQLSVEAKAENDTAGLVEGTEGIVGYNQPISANIVNGQIIDIKYKNNNGNYQQVGNAIDSNKSDITNIIDGTQVVGESVKATEDGNGDNISTTYAKSNNVYTKAQSDDKYLPKAYSNIYYYSADGLVDNVPTEPVDGVQFSAEVPAIDEVELASCERLLENKYHFTKNSTDESKIWLITDTNTTLQFRLLTYVTLNDVDTLLASQLSGSIEFIADEIKEVLFDSIYNELGNNEIDVDAGETFKKILYVSSVDNTTSEVSLISSLQYASSFRLSLPSDDISGDINSAIARHNISPTAHQDLFNAKQNIIDNSHKLSADLVDDTSTTNKFVTATEKNTWNGKQNALSQTQLDAVNSGIDSTKVGQIETNTSSISTINGKIPAQASAENQLADKDFVNSSIATNTANFIGTFSNITALENYAGTVTNNDYANVINQELDFNDTTEMNAYNKDLLTNFDYGWVVNGTKYDLYRFDIDTQTWGLRATAINKGDVSLITAYNRYKYNGSTQEWMWDYTVNTSGFTASQWAAINSGATSEQIAKIGTALLTTTAQDLSGAVNELVTTLSGKQDTLTAGSNISITNNVISASVPPSTLTGASDPTTATVGEVGQFYLNTTSGKCFQCTAKTAQGTTPETYLYTWNALGGGTAENILYITTAPIADNPFPGTLAIVVLTAEPSTKYNGYLYIVKES